MSDKVNVLQDDLKDCGVCSLLSIIRYYKGNISKEYLRELSNTTTSGVTALDLLKCAREIGFEAYGIKGKLSDLNNNILPAIAHVIIDKKYPHFVVIYNINYKKKQVLIMDPACGFVNYSFDDFENKSTSYFLIMKPKQNIPNLVDKNNYVEIIKRIIIDYKKVFITIIMISMFYMVFSIIESYQFKLLYEEFSKTIDNEIKLVFIILIILTFSKNLFNYLRVNLIDLFNIILDKTLIKDAFYHIINLPYLYYRNHTNGDLLTRINDLGNLKKLVSNLFITIFVDLTLAIIILIVMINISSALSLITISSLLLYSLVVFMSIKGLKKIIRTNYKEAAKVNNQLVESLASFETIKNFSIQHYIYKDFIEKYDSYSNNNKVLSKKLNRETFFKNLFITIGNLFVIYIGIIKLNNNELSLSSLITYMSLSNYLIDPIRNILNLHVEYQNVKESIFRIKEVYCIPKEETIKGNRSIDYLNGSIDVSHVSYSYNGIDKVIKDVSFSIREGERVLISGNSGSGKSTLIKLIIKYLDSNYQGSITVGGFDLKDIDIFSLRKNICYVSQNEYLYTDTIYRNITFGKRIKYDEFLKITKKIFVNEIVKNSSLGYNYVIENNGENISGGEKERIIIARSIFQNASIYIYDESFSEIDVNRERKILEYLFSEYPNKTFIVISHRFTNEDLFNKKITVGGGKYEFIK